MVANSIKLDIAEMFLWLRATSQPVIDREHTREKLVSYGTYLSFRAMAKKISLFASSPSPDRAR